MIEAQTKYILVSGRAAEIELTPTFHTEYVFFFKGLSKYQLAYLSLLLIQIL